MDYCMENTAFPSDKSLGISEVLVVLIPFTKQVGSKLQVTDHISNKMFRISLSVPSEFKAEA